MDQKPKTPHVYTITLSPDQLERLNQHLKDLGYERYGVDYALFAYRGNQVNIVAYQTGKTVIQGKKTADFVSYILEAHITLQPKLGYEAIHHPTWFEAHAGLDESGKGDFFGPLVTACVIAPEGGAQTFLDLGVKDSKAISSDAVIFKLEKQIRQAPGVVVKTTFAGMEKYNLLYGQFQHNLNFLLAWMHANSLKEALKIRPVAWGMLDQFSKAPLVQKYLQGLDFELRIQTKAEADPIVAAASIVARAVYLKEMDKLSEKAGEKLLRGAGAGVLEQAKRLTQKLGANRLHEFAKCHFRTATFL